MCTLASIHVGTKTFLSLELYWCFGLWNRQKFDRVMLLNIQLSDQLLHLPPAAVHGGNPVKNAWRMNNDTKDKWYVIFAKSPEEKQQWMEAFKRERERVMEDEEKGGCVGERSCVGRSCKGVGHHNIIT